MAEETLSNLSLKGMAKMRSKYTLDPIGLNKSQEVIPNFENVLFLSASCYFDLRDRNISLEPELWILEYPVEQRAQYAL